MGSPHQVVPVTSSMSSTSALQPVTVSMPFAKPPQHGLHRIASVFPARTTWLPYSNEMYPRPLPGTDPLFPLCAAGVNVILSIVFGGGFALQAQLIEAAQLAGVKRFVPSEFGVPLNILPCARLYLQHDHPNTCSIASSKTPSTPTHPDYRGPAAT